MAIYLNNSFITELIKENIITNILEKSEHLDLNEESNKKIMENISIKINILMNDNVNYSFLNDINKTINKILIGVTNNLTIVPNNDITIINTDNNETFLLPPPPGLEFIDEISNSTGTPTSDKVDIPLLEDSIIYSKTSVNHNYKKTICKHWKMGYCNRGNSCAFKH